MVVFFPVCSHPSPCTELASTSFGALIKAKRALGDDETSEEEDDESVRPDDDEDSNLPGPSTRRPHKTKEEMKRQNKHA